MLAPQTLIYYGTSRDVSVKTRMALVEEGEEEALQLLCVKTQNSTKLFCVDTLGATHNSVQTD